MRKEAYLTKPLSDGTVQCQVCEHFCAVKPGQAGKCGVRRNYDGTLYLVVYGKAVAIRVDPIEKKPLFHFLPRGDVLSIGTYGCNFRCSFCQNWEMAQKRDFDEERDYRSAERSRRSLGQDAPPEALVSTCRQRGIPMIAYTYNEPTVFFEYTYDTARLAHGQGIKNVYVSDGFMSRAALDMIVPYLDGINVDLKAFGETGEEFYHDVCGARLEPVKRNIRYIAQQTAVWIEVTTLLIPGLNDGDDELRTLAAWLVEVDPEIPWHVTAFRPAYKMLDRPPTLPRDLARAYDIGKRAGLHYVYVGNVMDADRESTHCPKCEQLLIRRRGYDVREVWPERGVCPRCGHLIPGVWD
jgi:pyruvate formate lyase activating enzyme